MKNYLLNNFNTFHLKIFLLSFALITLFSQAIFSQAPIVDFAIPINGATQVSLNSSLRIIFEDEIVLGVGTFEIRDYSTEDVVISVNQDSPNLVLEKFNSDELNTIAFRPLFNFVLDYTKQYYITISNGLVKSASDTNFPGFTNKSVWNFTTAGPGSIFTVNHKTPSALIDPAATFEVKVAAGQHFQMGSTGNLRLIDLSNGDATLLSLDPGASEIVITNNVITFNLNHSTTDLNEYTIHWDEGFFENTAGGLIEENNGDILFFRVYKAQNPILGYEQESFWPHDLWGPWEPTDDYLNVQFDRPVQAGSGKIGIYRYSDDQLIEEIDVEADFDKINTKSEHFFTDIEIYPATNFSSGERYYVTWNAGVFTELSSSCLPVAPLTDKDYWTFTIDGSLSLEILSVSPSHQSEIGHTLHVEIEFNKPIEIQPGGHVIQWKNYDTDAHINTITLADVEIEGNILRGRFIEDPHSGIKIYAHIQANRIKDLEGNFLPEVNDKDFWYFTPHWDFINRTFVPTNFSTFFPIDGDIKMVFEEEVKRSDMGSFTFRKFQGNEILASIPYDSDLVRFEENEVYFDVNHLMEYNTQYFITMLGVAIRNLDDLPTERFNDNATWVFRTEPDPDLFAQPISFSPAHESTNVPLDTQLSIEFSNPVTFGGGSVFLYNRSTDEWIRTIPSNLFSINENTVTIDLGDPLPLGTEIAVRVQAPTFISENYNVLTITDNNSWYFTTENEADLTPPQIVSVSPENGSATVPWYHDIEIEFDKDIIYTGGNGKVRLKNYANNGTVISFQASQITTYEGYVDLSLGENFLFNHGIKYFLEIDGDAFKSTSDVFFAGISDKDEYTFTTSWDMPEAISFDPSNNAVEVSVDQVITIGFDRDILMDTQGISGALYHIRLRQEPIDGGDIVDIDIFLDDGPITWSGNEVVITPAMPLEYGSNVRVIIVNNLIKERLEDNGEVESGSPFQGGVGSGFYNFYTTSTEKEPNTITFEAISDKTLGDDDFALIASASSGLEVSFSVTEGQSLVALNGNMVSILGAGMVTIRASQEGNENYMAAVPVDRSFEIMAVTGIEDLQKQINLTVFPNPVVHSLNIQFNPGIPAKLQLFDTIGNEVASLSESPTQRLDVSHLGTGMYLLMVHTSQGVLSYKILKH